PLPEGERISRCEAQQTGSPPVSSRATRMLPLAKVRVLISQGSAILAGLPIQSQSVMTCAMAAGARRARAVARIIFMANLRFRMDAIIPDAGAPGNACPPGCE